MSEDTHNKIAIIIASTFIASGTGGLLALLIHTIKIGI